MEDHYRELVTRCLSGLASAGEEAELKRLVASDPAHAAYYRRVREAWDVAGQLPEWHDPEQGLERVMRRAQGLETPVIPLRRTPAHHRRRRSSRTGPRWSALARVAAVLFAVAAAGAIWLVAGDAMMPQPAVQNYATGAGQRATLTLSDGSRILLGPESEVGVPSRFRRGVREVHLRGRALFEVAHDPRRPFHVHSSGVLTRVLGTRFVLRAYPGEEHVDVAVSEGRVAFRASEGAPEEDVILAGGQVGRFESGAARLVPGARVEALFDWTEGRLVFRDLPLHEVAQELGRWYGVEVRISDMELARRHVTLSFQDATLDEVLDALELSLGLRFDRQGRTATLYPQ